MKLAMIGLGRMGAGISRRLMQGGHEVVAWDRDTKAVKALAKDGAIAAKSLADVVAKLDPPRTLWVMLPAGEATESTVTTLLGMAEADDVIIDGGNSFYKDDIRRSKLCDEKGVHYIDVGTSGGVWGLTRGFCMMIGGNKKAVDRLDPIFQTLAPGLGNIPHTAERERTDDRAERGYIHAGPSGAGHFVKMVHNGIEYGIMQAYAEGFAVLDGKSSEELPEDQRYTLDLTDVAEVWRRGSVISSWLLDLAASALAKDGKLSGFAGNVADSGEGRWTIDAAVEEAVPVNVLAASLFARFRSRETDTFGDKLLSAMRFGFGGHVEPKR